MRQDVSEQGFSPRSSDAQSVAARALELAMEAKTIILQHQKTCDEDRLDRRKQIADLHASLLASKQEVQKVINRGMAYVIGILILSMGYFLVTFGLPGHH